MNYTQAVDYIEETPKFTTKNSLDHTRKCLRLLGNPQEKFRVIHVAGTNGKGSVCAFMTSILREGGCRCGLFTSPHLEKINERFQINEEPVDDDTFLEAFRQVKELADRLVAQGDYHPTYFEMLFLMGMVIFARAGVEYVALETGLGGRLDATNSIENPMACVITSISMDHMEYLGDTLPEIAGEKAGIIKPGVPVIYDANHPEAARVIEERARRLGCPAYPLREEQCAIEKNTAEGIAFSLKSEYYGTHTFQIPFIARYQMMNASLALTCMEVLAEKLSLTMEQMKGGLANTKWQGRMETILPGVIVDGAHNEDGVLRFLETARYFRKESSLTLLFSAVSDKDYQDMIGEICSEGLFSAVITTQVGGYREVPAGELAEVFTRAGAPHVEAVPDIGEAFQRALKVRGEGLLFCVGSLYLIGEIKTCIKSSGLAKEEKKL